MKNNVMIDIETLGNVSNSVIVSIGAVKFDIATGETGECLYQTVDIDSCLKKGMVVTGSTIRWWLSQSEEARNELINGMNVPIEGALNNLSQFIQPTDIVWSNGLRFDISLLSDAYNLIGKPIPWEFRNERDVRTLVSFAPEIKRRKVEEYKSTTHHALFDCILQIQYCSEIYNKINLK